MLHVAVLPAVLSLLIAMHFWRIRKDGGLSRPKKAEPAAAGCVEVRRSEPCRAKPAPERSTGCRDSCAAPSPRWATSPTIRFISWPNLLMAELFVFVLTSRPSWWSRSLFNAPLEEPVNVMHPPNPAKAPWYFLGLQEMVSYSAFWGGIGVPGTMVALLLLVPYIDRTPHGVGRWFARERLLANTSS